MTPFLSPRWLAILAFSGIAQATVPGVYAILEKQVAGPNGAVYDNFGGSEPRWVGDMNGDGIEDMVTGASRAYDDSGALVFQVMSYQGGVKQVGAISPRHPMIKSHLSSSGKEQFGSTVAVVLPFSSTRPCAALATTSAQPPKLWTLKVCKDQQGTPYVLSANVVDNSSGSPLFGLGVGASFSGSLQVIDTLPTGERMVAMGIISAGATTYGSNGRVAIFKVDTSTLSVTQSSFFPAAWDATDVVGADVAENARFGKSVARLGRISNSLRIAVLASGAAAGSNTGRVHIIDLDATYHVVSARWEALGVGPDTITGPTSISAADFDHNGTTDLLVGSPSSVATRSSFWVATLDRNSAIQGLQHFAPGTNGFADSATALVSGTVFGTSVLAGDLNQDGMVDAFVGAPGNAYHPGSLWSILMKSAPWVRKAPDTLFLQYPTSAYKILNRYVGGKTQGWSVRNLDPRGVVSSASCRIVGGGDTADLLCDPGNFNGTSTWRITVYDTLNTPATLHVYDSLDFVAKTSGIVAYMFGSDTLKLAPKAGIGLVRALDTVDAQHDTLSYQAVGNWPTWLQLGRFSITASSPSDQPDTVVKIAACKQLLPGPATWCSDTASVSVRFDGMTGIPRSRTILALSGRNGTLLAKGGSDPFRLEVFGTDGRLLGKLEGGAFASRRLDLRDGPATVLVRGQDGDKIRQSAMFLGK